MAVLEVQDVHYTYQTRYQTVPALQGVSAAFEEGKLHAVVGSSGCGKTTLLSLLAGLDVPSEGRILFDGQDLADMDRDAWRLEQVSVIYQNFNLLAHLTVLENTVWPLYAKGVNKKQAEEAARAQLAAVGLQPAQYARFPRMLSGGEQQRVAIARALAAGSRIVLADEPTGNLDEANSRAVFEMLAQLAHAQGRCVVVVTHDRELANGADSILALRDGRLAE